MRLPFLAVVLSVAALVRGATVAGTKRLHARSSGLRPGSAVPAVRQHNWHVLEGNPMAASGDYTIRLKLPDGYKIAPHTHPYRENVTVISGTLKVGMGDMFDAGKMMSFGAGSFAYLDPSMHHYAAASGAIFRSTGSRREFNWINPADDHEEEC